MKVLVVAEHAALRAQICKLLRELGDDDTRDAASGAEPLALLREVPIGMVIAQMDMTPMSGSQLHAAMRADPGCATSASLQSRRGTMWRRSAPPSLRRRAPDAAVQAAAASAIAWYTRARSASSMQ